MPVFQLTDKLIFPPAELAEGNGLLAIGGDLSPERLLPRASVDLGGFNLRLDNVLMLTAPLYMLQIYDRVLSSRSEATLVAIERVVIPAKTVIRAAIPAGTL